MPVCEEIFLEYLVEYQLKYFNFCKLFPFHFIRRTLLANSAFLSLFVIRPSVEAPLEASL